ncbi:MAG: RHS repeat protein, partial [Desulfobacterales bacterium]|nr:RHS repeat protein [Desulfobacterales bacterium]
MKIGVVNLPAQDMSVQAPGFPLGLEREYDSRDAGPGDFGPGWNLPSTNVKAMTTQSLSGGWSQEAIGGLLTTYVLLEMRRHVVVLRLSDEEVLKFKMEVTPKTSQVIPYGPHKPLYVHYTPMPGTTGTLQALDADPNVLLIGSVMREWGADLYDPARFKYTRPDGTVFIISRSGLESVTDAHGHTVSYTNTGVHHSSGLSIEFTRGADNRIEMITDPYGRQIEYHYTEDGMLERVIQVGGAPPQMRLLNTYGYGTGVFDRPVLKAIVAPDGAELGTFEYDAQGRATGLVDGNGNRVLWGFDLPNHRQTMTDRLGNTTIYEYDVRGNVTQKTDPLGNITQWTYDENDNKLSETDPLWHTTSYTYDAGGNILSETDPLGSTTSYTYNSREQVLTTTDPNGNVTSNTYDEKG